ncbi:hypothetical protein GCM10009579_39430 [Streptomyces javensis]|uniref:Uncharacterized protein n=1 Tax=Streptomyces javensis TaxID=114698 RepID=A0ABP4HTN6_9ACTN
MLAHSPVHLGLEQKWLGHDTPYGRIEISEEEPRQYETRLVDHVVAHRGGPVGARVVPLAPIPAKDSPG